MQDLLFFLLIFNLIINIVLVLAYIRLRRQMKVMDIEKYKNCIIEMMRIRSKFDEVSSERIRSLSKKIEELNELADVIDDRILYYEEIAYDDDRYSE